MDSFIWAAARDGMSMGMAFLVGLDFSGSGAKPVGVAEAQFLVRRRGRLQSTICGGLVLDRTGESFLTFACEYVNAWATLLVATVL
jgi:hypothetical protein